MILFSFLFLILFIPIYPYFIYYTSTPLNFTWSTQVDILLLIIDPSKYRHLYIIYLGKSIHKWHIPIIWKYQLFRINLTIFLKCNLNNSTQWKSFVGDNNYDKTS